MSAEYPFPLPQASIESIEETMRDVEPVWERYGRHKTGHPFHIASMQNWKYELSTCNDALQQAVTALGNCLPVPREIYGAIEANANHLDRLLTDLNRLLSFIRQSWKHDPVVRSQFSVLTLAALSEDAQTEKAAHKIFAKVEK